MSMSSVAKTVLLHAVILCYSNLLYSQFSFVENKNQWDSIILYKMSMNNGAMFLEKNCITFNFLDRHDHDHSFAHHGACAEHDHNTLNFHAYRVRFVGANPNPAVWADKPEPDYLNYYIGSDPSKWATRVSKYKEVTYENIYNNIDLKLYITELGLKYDFIIHPGGDLDDIVLEYEGVDNIKVSNNNLVIETTVNDVVELQPIVYQIFEGEKVLIHCDYNLKKNRLTYQLARHYDPNTVLVIDPSLVFSTYTGSTGDNWGFTATWDYNDNVYSGGIVFNVGYPTSMGAYQVNFAGGTPPIPNSTYYAAGCDVGIIKYSPNGTQRLFATYLGGAGGQEMPHSMVVTEENDLLIMGTTGSPDFPTSAGAYDATFNGGDSVVYDNVIAFPNGVDIFVAKIKEDGTALMGSTYIGGSANDGFNFKQHYSHTHPVYNINWTMMHGNDSLYYNYADGARGEIVVDNKNHIYVGTNTFSLDFPQGINQAYQPTSGGKQDGIVFKLKSDLTQLLWSSYLGGSEDDAIYSIDLGTDYSVYVAGGTVSTNFPTTFGAYKTSFQGGTTDGFVAHLNADGNVLHASSYYGSENYDQAYFVRTDASNNVFICGQTEATGSTLVYNAAYNNPNSGQFIAKFQPNLSSLVWSTVFGTGNGKPNISITAFAVDVCNRIYLSGWGRYWTFSYYNSAGQYYTWNDVYGTKGMDITPDAIQTQTDGQDFYIMVLAEDASQLEYATFFGEVHYDGCGYSGHDHVDGGTSRFDKKGHIIQSVCASCGGCQQFPTSPGVWSPTNGNGTSYNNCNNAAFKIRIIENLANASFDPIPAGCAPYVVQFNNNSQGSTFLWDFGDGTTSTSFNPSHTYAQGGTYQVMLVVSDPSSCNFTDTLVREIFVMDSGVDTLPDKLTCPGQQVVIGPEGNYGSSTFQWLNPVALNNPSLQNPIASPNQTTTYVLVIDGLCNDTVYQTVEVIQPQIDLMASNDTLICPGGTAVIHAASSYDNIQYSWSSSPNFNPIIGTGNSITVSPQNTMVYYVRAVEPECNTILTESVVVQVHQFNYSITPSAMVCVNGQTTLHINNNNSNDVLSFQWSPGSSIVSGANTAHPVVAPVSNTTYTVTITNQIGCQTTAQVPVTINNLMFSAAQTTNPLCYGDCTGSVSVSATGVAPYSYSWSHGASGASLQNVCAGSYTVTVTDNLQCTATQSVVIQQPQLLVAQFSNIVQPECDGIGYGTATVAPQGGTPPYSYSWSVGGTAATNTQLLTGINRVTITDAHGCDTVIEVEMLPPGNIGGYAQATQQISCYGECDGAVTAVATSGTAPFSYQWSNGASGSNINNLCSGPYMVSIIDSENCVLHQSTYLSQPAPLIGSVAVTQPILCYGETGSFQVFAQGGTMPYSYQWSNGTTESGLNNVSAGQYSVSITDANNCKDSLSVGITQPPLLTMESTYRNMRCSGVCNAYISVEAAGGTPEYSYQWSNNQNLAVAEGLCAGDYHLTLSDHNGCKLFESYTIVNENYIPPLDVYADPVQVYRGQSANLQAVAAQGSNFVWSPPLYLSSVSAANPISTPQQTITYEVLITDGDGCSNRDTITIRVMDIVCGEPFIFIPNAFTPNGDGDNDYFKPYAPPALITSMYFAVFDRWGEIIYESTNINDQGWDGTYRGKLLAPDVYVYFFEATCLNQDTYNQKGNVTLIR